MTTVLAVSGFCFFVLLATCLLFYVLAVNKKRARHVFRAAAMEESKGNYAAAITLFEKYLGMIHDSNEKVVIKSRIKILKDLSKGL